MPGSGKSTAADHISSSINSLWKQRHGSAHGCASVLPMDGEANGLTMLYHSHTHCAKTKYFRGQLQSCPGLP